MSANVDDTPLSEMVNLSLATPEQLAARALARRLKSDALKERQRAKTRAYNARKKSDPDWVEKQRERQRLLRIKNYLIYRERRLNNKGSINRRSLSLALTNRQKALDILGGKCLKCGYDDHRSLHIDHVEAVALSGSKRKGNTSHEVIRCNGDGFQLLCANCHAIKTREDVRLIALMRVKTKRADSGVVCHTSG